MVRLCIRPRCRQPRRSVIIGGLFMFVVTIVCVLQMMWKDLQCNNKDSVGILQELCDQFHSHVVTGNLCPHLCDYRTVWFHSCTNYRTGKQVLRARWMDQSIVLKSKHPSFSDFDRIQIPVTFRQFTDMVTDSLTFNFPKRPQSLTRSSVDKLWKDGIQKYTYHDDNESLMWKREAVDSLWSLVQQDEYLVSMVYNQVPYLPSILGTCGHFYAVEYTPSGPLLSPGTMELSGLRTHPWKLKAETALALIKSVEAFDVDFEERLHMCDMKGDNFGLATGKQGRLNAKVIDSDMAVLEGRLLNDIEYPNCTKHEDCSFFDCLGWCDISKGRCLRKRVNNNWQMLCEKIFRSSLSNANMGLLMSPPAEFSKISDLIHQCATPPITEMLPGCHSAASHEAKEEASEIMCPPTTGQMPRFKAKETVVKELKTLLESSIKGS